MIHTLVYASGNRARDGHKVLTQRLHNLSFDNISIARRIRVEIDLWLHRSIYAAIRQKFPCAVAVRLYIFLTLSCKIRYRS